MLATLATFRDELILRLSAASVGVPFLQVLQDAKDAGLLDSIGDLLFSMRKEELIVLCNPTGKPSDAVLLLNRDMGEYEAVRLRLQRLESKAASAKKSKSSTKVDEAEATARTLAAQDNNFTKAGVREWAKRIAERNDATCSISTVKKTPLWKETMATTGRARTKGATPKAVTFSDRVEAVIGSGSDVLDQLIAAEDETAAVQAVRLSGMDDAQRQSTLEKLARHEMTPDDAKQLADMFPRRTGDRRKPSSPFNAVRVVREQISAQFPEKTAVR